MADGITIANSSAFSESEVLETAEQLMKAAETLVSRINSYWKWADDDAISEAERMGYEMRAMGIEEALAEMGFSVGYDINTDKAYLAGWRRT